MVFTVQKMCLLKLNGTKGDLSQEAQALRDSTRIQWLCLKGAEQLFAAAGTPVTSEERSHHRMLSLNQAVMPACYYVFFCSIKS